MNPVHDSSEASPAATSAAIAAAAAAGASASPLPPPEPLLPPLQSPGPALSALSHHLPPPPHHHHHHQHHHHHPHPDQQHHHVSHQMAERSGRQPRLLKPSSPLMSKDGLSSSMSAQANPANMAGAESNTTSYSADTSPSLHQSVFSIKDGTDVSNNRRTSRRRTGPLSQQSRERAALIRKLGACSDCRRRRVACHPSHHDMTWEDVVGKFNRSHSPSIQDIAPSGDGQRPLSPASGLLGSLPLASSERQDMDMDLPSAPGQNLPGRPLIGEPRLRTPLPSGPRLDKGFTLPGIESLKNDLQSNASRMISTASRNRYIAVQVLLFCWQDDMDSVRSAVSDLADTFRRYYHYSVEVQSIPPSSDGPTRSSWRWLSRQLNDFTEEQDQRDVLKIVYYIGHSYLDSDRNMVLASSRDVDRASTIRWSGIQQTLEEACSDILIIMDSAYYPSTRMVRQRGVLEIIAASVSDERYSSIDRCAFTKTLIDILHNRAVRAQPLSAAELHALLLADYPKLIQEREVGGGLRTSFPAPLHAMASGNSRLPSIFISPIIHDSPLRSGYSHEDHPQLQLSIRLHDDVVDMDIWNEWLRLMPEGVKDVKVEGPFRSAFK